MPEQDGALSLLAARLAAAKHVAVLTGAGVSAESGLRTFRGASAADLPPDMRSLWAEFDPATLATPEAFARNPAVVSKWYDWRRIGCLAAAPNPGHLALAELEQHLLKRGGRFTLLTQNVDGLHARAGSRSVVELHGTILTWRCTHTGNRITPPDAPMPEHPAPSPFRPGAFLRPDVVWFGEALPEHALRAAWEASTTCDLFMSIGTSAVVQPAASFIRVASDNGATTAEINAEETPISSLADVVIRSTSGDALPRLVRLAFG